jgi:hypothetical protein
VCIIPYNNNIFLTIYVALIDAVIPFTIIVGVYIRLFIYVRRSKRTVASLLSSKRELHMAKNVFFLLGILGVGAMPGTIFHIMNPPPDYQYRIYYMNVAITSFCALLCMFLFTPQVKQWLIQKKNTMNTRVYPQANPVIVDVRNRY